MQQSYGCPTCGNVVNYGDRFCGTCGTTLEWPVEQAPPPPIYPQQPVFPQQPMYPQQPGYQPQSSYPQMPPPYQPPPMNRPPPMQQPGWGQQQWVPPAPPPPPPPPVWNQPMQQQPPPPWGQQPGRGGYPPSGGMPGYGQALPPKQGSSVGLIFLTLLVIVVIGGGVVAMLTKGSFDISSLMSSSASKPPASTASAPATPASPATPEATPAPAAPVVVTSQALVDEYKANKAAADAKYKNKRIQVSGAVASMDLTVPSVTLTDNGSPDAQGAKCIFTQGSASDISQLELAKSITIEGKVTEFNVDVSLVECTFIKK